MLRIAVLFLALTGAFARAEHGPSVPPVGEIDRSPVDLDAIFSRCCGTSDEAVLRALLDIVRSENNQRILEAATREAGPILTRRFCDAILEGRPLSTVPTLSGERAARETLERRFLIAGSQGARLFCERLLQDAALAEALAKALNDLGKR